MKRSLRTLLIVGCGDVLRRALPALVGRWRVIALTRARDPALDAFGIRQIVGDLDDRRSLRRLAGIADAVIHGAPPPPEGSGDPRTGRLIAALRRGRSLPRRLVYISTSGVYGDCGGALVAETRPPAAQSARAARRVDAERRLRRFAADGRCRALILRAPGIYAADRLPLERLRRGLPLLVHGEDSHTNHIHADDLAAACVRALDRGGGGRCYNISDDSTLAMGEWFDLLADSFGLPHAPRIGRAEAEHVLPPMQWSFMRESRRLDNRRMKRELRLRLRHPDVASGLADARRKGLACSG